MGHIEIVKLLLNDNRTEVNAVSIPGESALSRSCYSRNEVNLDIIEILMDHPDIDPSIPKNRFNVC